MSAAVELVEVTRHFGSLEVLRGISLAVEPGEVIAIYGPSGSGKTTLLNLIGGLDRPTSGQVLMGGRELSRMPVHDLDELRRTAMAFVFQSYGLLSHLSARENVEFGLRLASAPRQVWRERAEEALDWVGLVPRAHHRPAELSGGERQRVALARAMAVRPRLLLADEPTGALDHATGMQIIDLLVRFARQTGVTIWLVTHDVAVRERVDRSYHIRDGRLNPE